VGRNINYGRGTRYLGYAQQEGEAQKTQKEKGWQTQEGQETQFGQTKIKIQMIEQCLQVSKPTNKSQEGMTMSHHSVYKAMN
jgi:hypothetical protein